MPDSFFGPPVIRAKTMQEKLADWFSGRKYNEDPSMLSALAAMIAPLASLAPGPGKAVMLPNIHPERNIRTAMEYLGDRNKMSPRIGLRGDWGLNQDILSNAEDLENIQWARSPTVLRRVNPDLVEPSQATVQREGVRNYVEQAGNGGEFVNGFMPHPPGTYNPVLYKVGNRFIATDGHHRTSANLLLGRPSLSEVFDVDRLMKDWSETGDPDNISYRMLQVLMDRFKGGR